MVIWSKSADWLPLSNAQAQVSFWEQDLQHAIQYLNYVRTFRDKKILGYSKIELIAIKDTKVSIRELAKAKAKLVESEHLELIFGSH